MAEETKDRIVTTAQSLFFSKGYGATSIADIITAVDIAKGTFYHHFSSKTDLLDEIVDRFTEEIVEGLQPILEDESLDALTKLNQYLVQGFAWKVHDRERFFMLLNAVYSSENLLLRKKMTERSISISSPILAGIVKQGVEERVFDTPIPDRAGELALRLFTSMGDQLAALFSRLPKEPDVAPEIEKIISDAEYGMERLIGTPEGAVSMINRDDLYALTKE